jgi:hypothetical protein
MLSAPWKTPKIDTVIGLDEVGYSIMTIKKNSDFAGTGRFVLVSDPGVSS